jgi:hypothetical protein
MGIDFQMTGTAVGQKKRRKKDGWYSYHRKHLPCDKCYVGMQY